MYFWFSTKLIIMTSRTTSLSKILKTLGQPILLLLIFIGVMTSCGEASSEVNSEEEIEETKTEATEEFDNTEVTETITMDPRLFGGGKAENQLIIDEHSKFDKSNNILGMYVGAFGKNMINIMLYKMENGITEGYSVCAGNFRKLNGTYKRGGEGIYELKLDEPGDDQYDGSFEFTTNGDDLSGKWTPFKTEGNSAKTYTLTKKKYKFDVNNGDYPETSTRLLTEDDVNNLNGDELAYMRNCIYARHGYSFKDKTWRYTFEELAWYMPTCIDVRDKLSNNEVANIELIYEYESYFEMYYDDYGR
jgi:hypothetical protein